MPDSWDAIIELSTRKGPTARVGGAITRPPNYNDLVTKYTTDDDDDFKQFALNIHKAEYSPTKWVSSAGAIGPMQLMPETAKGLGVDPNDPEQNVEGGVRHLRRLYEKYNKNKILAAAAYNAGEGAVERYGGVPPYAETKNYVRKVNGGNLLGQSNSRKITAVDIWGTVDDPTGHGDAPVGDVVPAAEPSPANSSQGAKTPKNDPKSQALFNKLLGKEQSQIPGFTPPKETIASKALTAKSKAKQLNSSPLRSYMGPAIGPTTTPPVIRPTTAAENLEAIDARRIESDPLYRAFSAGRDSLAPYVAGLSYLLDDVGKRVSIGDPTAPKFTGKGLFERIGDAVNEHHSKQSQVLGDLSQDQTMAESLLNYSSETGAQLLMQIPGAKILGVPGTFATLRALRARGSGVTDSKQLAKEAAIGYGEGLLFKGVEKVPGQVGSTVAQATVGGGLAAAQGGGVKEVLEGAATQAGLHVGLGGLKAVEAREKRLEEIKQQRRERIGAEIAGGVETIKPIEAEIPAPVETREAPIPNVAPAAKLPYRRTVDDTLKGTASATEPTSTTSAATRKISSPDIADGQPLEIVEESESLLRVKLPSGAERTIPKGSELHSRISDVTDAANVEERLSGLNLLEAGRDLYKLGTTFKDWAGKMIEQYGEEVSPELPRLFNKARNQWLAERENDKLSALALSKVKHPNGDPIEVFHGSPQGVAIEKVDFGKLNSGDWIRGFFTTQAAEVTAGYAGKATRRPLRSDELDRVAQFYLEEANKQGIPVRWDAEKELTQIAEQSAHIYHGAANRAVKAVKDRIDLEINPFNAPNVHKFYLDIRNPLDLDAPLTPELKQQLITKKPEYKYLIEGATTGQDLLDNIIQDATAAELPAPVDIAHKDLVELGFDGATHIGGETKTKTFTDRVEAEQEARRSGGKLEEVKFKLTDGEANNLLENYSEFTSWAGIDTDITRGSAHALQLGLKYAFGGEEMVPSDVMRQAQTIKEYLDGIPVRYEVKGHRVWIAFHPDQVISATATPEFSTIGAAPTTKAKISDRYDPERGVLRYSGIPIFQSIKELSQLTVKAYDKLAPEKLKTLTSSFGHLFVPLEFAPQEVRDVLFSSKGLAEKAEARLSGLMQHWDLEFARLPLSETIDALDRMKTGAPQATPDLQRRFDFFRQTDDQLYLSLAYSTMLRDPKAMRLWGAMSQIATTDIEKIQFLENLANQTPQGSPQLQLIADKMPESVVNNLTHYIEDHFRILWKEKPRWADDDPLGTGAFLGRRPLQGSRGFQRQHQLANFSDGLITQMKGDYGDWGRLLTQRGLVPGTDFRATVARNPTQAIDPETEILPLTKKGFAAVKALAKESPYNLSAIRFGGEPVSWNPATLFKLSYADAYRYISAQSLWKQMGDRGYRMWLPQNDPLPKGFTELNDKIAQAYFRVQAPGYPVGVKVSLGRWVVQENLGELLNNHLARDPLIDVHSAETSLQRVMALTGRTLRDIKNHYTMIELGLSPFHMLAEGMEVIGSTAGLGIRQVAQGFKEGSGGLIVEGMKNIVTAPLQPLPIVGPAGKLGRGLRQLIADPVAFKLTPEGQALMASFPNADQIISDLFSAGAIPYRHKDYTLNWKQRFIEAKTAGASTITNPAQSLRWMLSKYEGMTDMLFDKAIPNWKMALFAQEYSLALREYADQLTTNQVTRGQLARKAWNFVEHRMGELNMDNFYWDRALRTTTQIMVRAFPWVYGNLAAGANVVPDAVRLAKTLTGEQSIKDGPIIGQNLAWLAGMSFYTALTGGLMMKIMSGLWPGQDRDKDGSVKWKGLRQAAEDSINPRIDQKDSTERILIPTMWREYQGLAHSIATGPGHLPTEFASHKLAGWLPTLVEELKNEKFDKSPVYYEDEGLLRQIAARAIHLLPAPIGPAAAISSYKRTRSIAESVPYALGASRAPYFTRWTDAEELANKYAGEVMTPAEKTRNVWERRATIKDLKSTIKHTPDKIGPQLAEAIQNKKIRPGDLAHIVESQQTTPLMASVKMISITKALKVLEAATPDEKRVILPMLLSKLDSAEFQSLTQTQQLSIINQVLKSAEELKMTQKMTQ